MNKRRVGLGFTGLGDALIMLRLRYDTRRGARDWRRRSPQSCATTPTAPRSTWRASAARSRCSMPTCTCRARSFASRLPAEIKAQIRKHGMRNSHLLSIAPTGTISLAFADNASNGIEPPFSWTYTRKKRMADGTLQGLRGRGPRLAPVQASGRRRCAQAAACRISSPRWRSRPRRTKPWWRRSRPSSTPAISKTVNVPEDYPYEDFQDLYIDAWKAGLKGLATYRPNNVLGSVLSVGQSRKRKQPQDFVSSDANRRIEIKAVPEPGARQPALAGPARARRRQSGLDLHDRAPARRISRCSSAMSKTATPASVRSLGQRHRAAARPGRAGEDAVDGHARRRPAWLRMKLDMLAKTAGDDAFDMPFPPHGEDEAHAQRGRRRARSWCAGAASELGALPEGEDTTPVLDAMFA